MQATLTFYILLFWLTGAWADPLLGLPPVLIPADNPQTPEKIALGKRLFNDKRFSADGSISCASCHDAKRAFTDGLSVAKGINSHRGFVIPRLLLMQLYMTVFFWMVEQRA